MNEVERREGVVASKRLGSAGAARSAVVLLIVAAVSGSAAATGRSGAKAAVRTTRHAANPVQRENRLPGTRSWSRNQIAPPRAIEGYASEASALPGHSVHFHVSTAPAARYRIVLYRLGWYHGAGARVLACIPGCKKDRQAMARLEPHPDPTTGLIRAGWPVTDTFRFPRRTVSGYFLAKLLLTSGHNRGKVTYVPLVVRALRPRHSKILVQAAVNTWQAYNSWGGKSLYAYNSTDHVPATHVSFDRPYTTVVRWKWEIGLTRYLERNGYDVSYTTDADTDRRPRELGRHRLVISSGHDEYWSKTMRDGFEAARDGGTNLMFLGADIADWQIRFEHARRTIVEYRDATADPEPNPALKTVRFRELVPARPQCELLGISYKGVRTAADAPRAYAVNPAALKDPWFKGTGFTSTSTLPDSVGYEWDAVKPGCNVPPLTIFFHYAGPGPNGKSTSADAVRYVAPSGAKVFSSGSLQFTWGLDNYSANDDAPPNPHLQRFMRNALARLTSRR